MKKKAFTLVEATCALIISSLVIISISLVTTSMKQVSKMNLEPTITWHLFLRELESANHRFELIGIRDNHLLLYSQITDQKYDLKGNHTLYLTCQNEGGYMPLLDNIKDHEYSFTQLDSQRVLIKVTRKNGEKMSAIVRLYPSK
ncbi:ComGF family competence protein [Limosilactobacillus agrestis]|uniref:ComGF family competence protein n=1 Tax=Limosilactobacillus agrestis TaxID=2759748 RepID=A0A7W3YL62_9LACO|nr:ComGF family competence protein [Limosilactobacillus agrestis]MBD5091132.1 ComGF family competence protein [Lactobacillus sp.]MBB1095160.1 ComGF family competence protein [Limosilactobacillus agrestis]MBB1098952.1 ComGF family competence protein [Limosilactobacillus agrestis]MCD7112640.1 ComGF family competence protein [Limosilactobacillus agrestis]MCD7126163.1 ComGF family competence protein [Limosilactobacillus agrestis]